MNFLKIRERRVDFAKPSEKREKLEAMGVLPKIKKTKQVTIAQESTVGVPTFYAPSSAMSQSVPSISPSVRPPFNRELSPIRQKMVLDHWKHQVSEKPNHIIPSLTSSTFTLQPTTHSGEDRRVKRLLPSGRRHQEVTGKVNEQKHVLGDKLRPVSEYTEF